MMGFISLPRHIKHHMHFPSSFLFKELQISYKDNPFPKKKLDAKKNAEKYHLTDKINFNERIKEKNFKKFH